MPKWQLVRWHEDPTVWVTDGIRLVKAVPNPRVRDILKYVLQDDVHVITDQEWWDFLKASDD